MSIAVPWFLLMMTEAWRFGIKAPNGPQMPEPSRFILGSVAMGFCAVVAMANPRIGGLLAWGFLIGAIVRQAGPNAVKPKITAATATTHPANSSTGNLTA